MGSTFHIHQLNMTVPPWQPGTQYNYGDIVDYEGKILVNLDDSHSLIVLPRCQIQNNPAPFLSGNPAVSCTIQSNLHRLILLLYSGRLDSPRDACLVGSHPRRQVG